MRVLRLACVCCALISILSSFAFAQAVTGTVLGVVTDSSGATVASGTSGNV